ncbi:precorrin-2 C(20)-methyltransferase [Luteipulveratus mongoliensis]|uniref:ATP-binding protein n=1 Tax=Luteipulveratus mongoliensis TaxID=571913 RepID=A0A0K1JMJ7_9MICO|nr:precorrin-2 C(20)-methyltransferase [Luteipulveratus mongoliensis]AKU17803.1 ATP-binding protein [Luteipulveratus mongoliensis]
MSTGILYGIGVGPGDPELLTLKAVRLIDRAGIIAYHSGRPGSSNARAIVADRLDGKVEEELVYPVTTGTVQHPGGYAGAMEEFYEASASRLAAHLAAGRDVVLLSEGDPLFYGSFMYMYDRLSADYRVEIVPGVTSMAAATATAAMPLVRQADVLTVLPGTLPEPELARRLADTEGAVIMKLGRTFPAVRRALESAGRLDDAVFVERASTDRERLLPVSEVDPASVPYFSVILVGGDSAPSRRRHGEASKPLSDSESRAQEVYVVGLGPGPDEWMTPEVSQVLAEVDHVIGYAPYVNRVPQRPGLLRHSSGNTVEVDRGRLALDLAVSGERVAVVSGGDAGVFGMASAVFEAQATDPAYDVVHVRVLPGLSAVQAVAARAGAPIGGDFAVMSLSDRLKPWSVIEERLRAVATADLVLAIYNPRSRARPHQLADAQRIMLEHKDSPTPVIIGRDAGRTDESLVVTTLGELDPETVDMKCLLIIGSSATRVSAGGAVWTARSVARSTS